MLMKNRNYCYKSSAFLLFFIILFSSTVQSQNTPELIYYKFDGTGTEVVNHASSPVGSNPATIASVDITQGGTGQFVGALQNTTAASSSDYLNSNWATNLPGTGFTISMWMNNMPSGSDLHYLFRDPDASSFRCFIAGAAGDGNIILRGGGMEDCIIPTIWGGPVVIHYVYDGTNIIGYKNGVEVVRVADNSSNVSGGSNFQIGALPAGSSIDEFRIYNRALSSTEVANTWDQDVSGPIAVPLKPIAIFILLIGLAGFVGWKSFIVKITN